MPDPLVAISSTFHSKPAPVGCQRRGPETPSRYMCLWYRRGTNPSRSHLASHDLRRPESSLIGPTMTPGTILRAWVAASRIGSQYAGRGTRNGLKWPIEGMTWAAKRTRKPPSRPARAAVSRLTHGAPVCHATVYHRRRRLTAPVSRETCEAASLEQTLVADRIAQLLQREGAEFVVGFPENRLLDSASALGMRPIITRTERVAVNIADGFARATNGERITAVRDPVRTRRRGRIRRRRPGLRRSQPDPPDPRRARPRQPGCGPEPAHRTGLPAGHALCRHGQRRRPRARRVPAGTARAARGPGRAGAGRGRKRRPQRGGRRRRLGCGFLAATAVAGRPGGRRRDRSGS